MTAADSGEAAWAGRLLTGRKPKGMVSQKSHWPDQHSLEIHLVLQQLEFIKVVLLFLSIAAFWGYLTYWYHLLLVSKPKEKKIKSPVAFSYLGKCNTQPQLLFFPSVLEHNRHRKGAVGVGQNR